MARPGGRHRSHAAGRPSARGRGRGSVPGRQHLAQVILGAQSQHVISTLKHYTAYNQDYGRIGFTAIGAPAVNDQVSERALQEIYETPFRIAVQQGGVDSVMCSYNQINGVPSCENPTTLGDLKQPAGVTQ